MKNSVLIAAGGLVAIALALSVSGYVVADAPPPPDIAKFEQQKMYERSVGQSTPDQDDIRMWALIENEGVGSGTNNTVNTADTGMTNVKISSNAVREIQNEYTLIPGTNIHAIVMDTVGYTNAYHLVINPHIQAEVGDYINWYDYGINVINNDREVDFYFTAFGFITLLGPNDNLIFSVHMNHNHTSMDPAFITHLVTPGEYTWQYEEVEALFGPMPREYNTIKGTITVTYPEPEPIPITNQTG